MDANTSPIGDFYGNGSALCAMHPDASTNAEIIIAALCARLDTARQALAEAAAMQVVNPALQRVKANAAWAMDETQPSRFAPRSGAYATKQVSP